jgi:gluconokinase
MAGGTPLTDADRRPWLQALRNSVAAWIEHGMHGVLAASLLTAEHRAAVLAGYEAQVKLVYLRVAPSLLRERLTARRGHFAGVQLLDSQLALLQEPTDALVIDGSQSVERLVPALRRALHV